MPCLSRFGMFAFGFDPLYFKEDLTLRVRFRPSGRVRFRPPARYKYSEECLAKTRLIPETCLTRNPIHKHPSRENANKPLSTSARPENFKNLQSPSQVNYHLLVVMNASAKTRPFAMFLIKCVAQKLDIVLEDRPTPDQFHVIFMFVPPEIQPSGKTLKIG